MSLENLNQIFFSVIDRNQSCVIKERVSTQWSPVSSADLYRSVVSVARALSEWGISKGDRVAILSENRPEWLIADFACQLLGAVVVPVYTTLTPEQIAYMLRDSATRVIFVSSAAQAQKVLASQPQTSIEKIVIMDNVDISGTTSMSQICKAGPAQRDHSFDERASAIAGPDDPATIIYTSGTTGIPKGVMLTHRNMTSNIAYSLNDFDLRTDDVSISFLPLSHITARHVDFALLYHGVTLAYVPFIEQLPEAMLQVRPTIFVGVPRVYEKIHARVELTAKSFPKKSIYRWALGVGNRHRNEVLRGHSPASISWKIADRLMYSKLRAAFGGRVRRFISGGAPLGRELAEWYADMGIRIHEGYGLTETSPVIAVNNPRAHKLGTVGKSLSNVEVRIAEDGEILVRGPSVFRGYWNLPEETKNAFVDGWFKTGDIGVLDSDGFLSITDRKKDLIKTSGGKFIAPQPIESSLKHNAFVAEAVVLGDRRKFPSVLIVPAFAALEDWAHAQKLAFGSREELIACEEVRDLYEKIVDGVNQNLARFEKLKKLLLVADEFSAEKNTLTASMKVRRREVEQRYSQQIEEVYSRAESPEASS